MQGPRVQFVSVLFSFAYSRPIIASVLESSQNRVSQISSSARMDSALKRVRFVTGKISVGTARRNDWLAVSLNLTFQ